MLDAASAIGVFPVLLDHPVVTAEDLVELGPEGNAAWRAESPAHTGLDGSEVEVALIRIFLSAGIKPGIQVGIGNGFKLLVRQYVDESIRAANTACRAVWAGALDFAARRAAVGVANERPLDVLSTQRLVRVEPAELRAESLLAHVRRRDDRINTVGIRRQSIAEGPVHDVSKLGVGEPGTLGAGIEDRAAQSNVPADVAGVIAIGRRDVLVRRIAQRIDEVFNQADRSRGVGSGAAPIAVPDDVNGDRIAFQYRTAVVVDAVAGNYGLPNGLGDFDCSARAVWDLYCAVVASIKRLLRSQKVDCQKHKEEHQKKLTKGKFHLFLYLTGLDLLATVREEKTEEAGICGLRDVEERSRSINPIA